MNPAQHPPVSIIIPHYNDLKSLDRCLSAIEAQTYPAEKIEIIVADNGSKIGLQAVAAAVGDRALVIDAPIQGAGPARNAGAGQASHDIFAFTDSDCVPEPQWLESGIAALAAHDFVGGRVTVLIDHDGPMTPSQAFESVFAFNNAQYVEKKGFTGSGNLFCPRRVFETTGGFRTTVSEDVEWSHRARSKGFTLGYCNAAAVGHPARDTWAQLITKWRRVNREAYAFTRAKPNGTLIWLMRTWALPASILAHTPKVFTSRALSRFGDRMRALGALFAIRMWRFWDQHKVMFERKSL